MTKKPESPSYMDWYHLWMKQSKAFFASADKNLQPIFLNNSYLNPEENLKLINEWLNTLKDQWSFMKLPDDQGAASLYWKNMNKMCHEASDLMVQQWIHRAQENKPIKNIRELYDLWLSCCHEIYEKHLQTKPYQDAYGDLMNAAFQYWKTNVPQ